MSQPTFIIDHLGICKFSNPISEQQEIAYQTDDKRLPLIATQCQNIKNIGTETLELAGPREKLFFQPEHVRAAIVTCGGLCPGFNAVIRELVMQLWHVYKCEDTIGIRYGYQGLAKEGAMEPMKLTPDIVSGIKALGGTMLGSSRGTPSSSEIVDSLERLGINMLFVIGGDGTMRGGNAIWREVKRRKKLISVIGIPKTIDNDIPFVRRTFGFSTAVEKASDVINAAEIEAKGMPHGVGLVKLMGRDAGFIAATASVASGNANLCLIPELPFELKGKSGILDLIEKRLRVKDHAVIVIAEGAGQNFVSQTVNGTDASGNPKLGDIGSFLKKEIKQHLTNCGIPVSMKYFDPSYLIRATGPNASDQLYCGRLARAATHAAMAGKTGMLIGHWYDMLTHIPFRALENQSRRINIDGELWFSVRENTGQPQYLY